MISLKYLILENGGNEFPLSQYFSNRQNFNYYQNRVLSKTNGQNIHRITGLLALISDYSRHTLNSIKNRDIQDAMKCEAVVNKCKLEIKKLSGVSI